MTLRSISKEAFLDHIASSSTASFLQSGQMGDLLTKRGYTITYLAYYHGDQIVVSALVYTLTMTGGLHMELNSGPIVTDEAYLPDFYQSLQVYAKEKGALELIVKPYQTYQTFDSNGLALSQPADVYRQTLLQLGFHHDGFQTGYPGGEPDWHYVKDLSKLSEDTLIQSFSKKGKPLIKKANTFGIRLRKLKREELHLFKEITSATSDRREYSDKSLSYYQDFYDSFGEAAEFMMASLNFQDYLQHLTQDQATLQEKIDKLQEALQQTPSEKKQNQLRELQSQWETFEVRKAEARDFIQQYGQEDVLLAASLFVYTEKEATYLFSGSYPAFNKFYAPALLQEYVMKQALQKGISFYNFLGITGLFDGTDGVLRFKQNFNGFIVRKMGTFRYYPRPLRYKLIQIVKKLLRR